MIEAGVGSGALTCYLLRAVGPTGRLISYERREDFAAIARTQRGELLRPDRIPAWELRVGDLVETLAADPPGGRPGRSSTCSRRGSASTRPPTVLVPGGVLCAYVATTTQLARTVETIRVHSGFTEPEATEIAGPRLARRRTGRTPPARHGRPHRLPDHRPAAGSRCHRHRSANVAQRPARMARITPDRAASPGRVLR